MRILVMLVEGVGAPKDAVAVRTGVALVTLVELILVPFPVKFSLKSYVAKGAPVSALGFGGPPVAALHGRRRGRRQRRCNVLAGRLGRHGAHRGRCGQDTRSAR